MTTNRNLQRRVDLVNNCISCFVKLYKYLTDTSACQNIFILQVHYYHYSNLTHDVILLLFIIGCSFLLCLLRSSCNLEISIDIYFTANTLISLYKFNELFYLLLFIVAKPVQLQKSDSSASSKSSGSASSGSTDSSSDSESSESVTSSQPRPKKKEMQPNSTLANNTTANVPPKRPSAAVAPVKPQKCTKRQGLSKKFSYSIILNNITIQK